VKIDNRERWWGARVHTRGLEALVKARRKSEPEIKSEDNRNGESVTFVSEPQYKARPLSSEPPKSVVHQARKTPYGSYSVLEPDGSPLRFVKLSSAVDTRDIQHIEPRRKLI